MIGINQHIDILISKVISGNANPKEKEQLNAWIEESPENNSLFQKSQKAWEESTGWISIEIISHDREKVQRELQNELICRIQKISRTSFIYKIAAILAIPITFVITRYFVQYLKDITTKDEFCEVSAPKGHVSKCILPDGTEVWINTGSAITYNTASFNTKSREIQLTGEAYFEVSKNRNKSFLVKTAVGKCTGDRYLF